ncbi:ABC-type transport system extracellular binding protein (probable substrate N-acetylglucosamine) [Halobacillus halophilus DSM 2266]|uniref:ABC-type transport system extracellular binding protein (Probable substrate N-acetylglucosamine) n=1 Tax=Halobacillus halophilus (strain ATCC 35676 / DSM 2266 / JCM 20832 / KCTC 3685 / LMG 17431 / NBRC 102448 / NCIMB 2269) TaxID=866895 RepID=I0JQS0_HALH3|nr:ABC-type transport system extracellular binding protein (probable substrate N-acetylglucosamine) [Halobacillus halophilus DSM 2266]
MTIWRKQSAWFMLVAFLVLVLAACAPGAGSEDTSSESEGSDSEGSSESGGDGEISGELEIQYFVGGYGDSWWKEVIGDFKEKYPDVTITEHAGPNINEEMRSRWVSDDPPDVVYIDGAGSSETQMVEDGQLMNLTDWMNGIELEDGTPLSESFIVDPAKYDGDVYSLPLVFDTWGTWYDSAWFEEKGWDVPKDFPGFMDTMGQIKQEEDIAPFVTTGQYPYYFLRGMLYPAFGAAGGDELLNKVITGEEGAWTSEPVLNVMKKVEQMQKEGYIDPGFGALNHTQSQMNFLMHDNAFIPVGFWLPNEMEKDTPEDFQYGFIPSPMQDEGDPYAIVPDLRPLAIAEKAENPEAAKAFVEFVFTKEYAKLFSEHTGAIMNLQGVDLASSEEVPQFLIEANKMINDPDQVQIYQKPHPMSSNLETPISNSLVSLMLGNITAEEFVEEAEKAASEYRSNLE